MEKKEIKKDNKTHKYCRDFVKAVPFLAFEEYSWRSPHYFWEIDDLKSFLKPEEKAVAGKKGYTLYFLFFLFIWGHSWQIAHVNIKGN